MSRIKAIFLMCEHSDRNVIVTLYMGNVRRSFKCIKKIRKCANNFVKMVNTINHTLHYRYYNFECVVNGNGLNLSVLFTWSVQQKQSVFRSFIHAAIKLPCTHPRVYPITRPTIYHPCNNKSIYPCIYSIDLPTPSIYPSTKIIGNTVWYSCTSIPVCPYVK